MEKLVIVPTYNERENIDGLLDQVLALPCGLEILIGAFLLLSLRRLTRLERPED